MVVGNRIREYVEVLDLLAGGHGDAGCNAGHVGVGAPEKHDLSACRGLLGDDHAAIDKVAAGHPDLRDPEDQVEELDARYEGKHRERLGNSIAAVTCGDVGRMN